MKSEVARETKETAIRVVVEKGTGAAHVDLTGASHPTEPGQGSLQKSHVVFARHMFETLAKWSGYDVTIEARSKDGLEHHLIEDVAISLGRAFRQAIDTGKIQRVADTVIPMDDALVHVALDLVERPYYEGPLPDPLMDHVLRSIAIEGGFTLHVVTLRGRDPHHVTEAAFKGLARCIQMATEPRGERLSTKGEVGFFPLPTSELPLAVPLPPRTRGGAYHCAYAGCSFSNRSPYRVKRHMQNAHDAGEPLQGGGTT